MRRDEKFAIGRSRIARHIATPSAIWNDTAVWTAADDPNGDSSRVLTVGARERDGHYQFTARADVPPPDALAAARHEIDLQRLPTGDYRWRTRVDFAIGTIRAADLAAMLGATLAAADGRDERDVRLDYAAAFPRATRVLGRLFTLDTLRATPRPDGSTALDVTVTMHPDGVRPALPAFADYLDKYIRSSSYHFVLADHGGTRWFDLQGRDGRLTIAVRERGGRFAPLDDGPARPMPDSLVLTADALVRFKMFNVGFTHLVAAFILADEPHERGWTMRFRQEPDWHLPLAVHHLIRSPLRRPFEGDGALMRFWVRDSAGAQTLSSREVRFAVHESAIVRFLGALVFSAMDDFAGRSEAEEALYNVEVWNAFRADIRALGPEEGARPAGEMGAETETPPSR